MEIECLDNQFCVQLEEFHFYFPSKFNLYTSHRVSFCCFLLTCSHSKAYEACARHRVPRNRDLCCTKWDTVFTFTRNKLKICVYLSTQFVSRVVATRLNIFVRASDLRNKGKQFCFLISYMHRLLGASQPTSGEWRWGLNARWMIQFRYITGYNIIFLMQFFFPKQLFDSE